MPKNGAMWQQFISRQGLGSHGPVCRRYQLFENPERSLEECPSPPQDSASSLRMVEPRRTRALTTASQERQNCTFCLMSHSVGWPNINFSTRLMGFRGEIAESIKFHSLHPIFQLCSFLQVCSKVQWFTTELNSMDNSLYYSGTTAMIPFLV